MKCTILLFLLLFIPGVYGQVPAIWPQMMERKDLQVFSQYADHAKDRRAEGELDTVFYRDICGDFKEGLFTYKKWLDSASQDGHWHILYEVGVITKQDKIIYGRVKEVLERDTEEPDSVRFAERAVYKDDAAYSLLRKQFKKMYKADMLDAELFMDDIVYGDGCGFGAVPPEAREVMDSIIAHRDKAAVLSWLQSANTEKQLYGMDGCYQLKRQGMRITSLERDLIKAISKKKGTVSGCSGCIVGPGNISYIVPQIKHRPKDIADRTGRFNYEGIN